MTEKELIDEFNDREEKEPAIDPKLLWIKVRRNWPFFLITIAGSLLLAFAYHRYTSEQYRLTSTLLIPETNSSIDPSVFQLFSINNSSNFLNELEILKSDRITGLALNSLDFQVEYYSSGRIKSIEQYKKCPFEIVLLEDAPPFEKPFTIQFYEGNAYQIYPKGQQPDSLQAFNPYRNVKTNGMAIRVEFNRTTDLNGKSYQFVIRSKAGLLKEWVSRLEVSPKRESTSVASLSVTYTHAGKGADFLNAVMNAYMSEELDRKNKSAQRTISYVNEQMSALSDTLNVYSRQLDEVRIENLVTDIDNIGNDLMAQIAKLEAEKQVNELAINALEENLNLLNNPGSLDRVAIPVSPALEADFEKYISKLQDVIAIPVSPVLENDLEKYISRLQDKIAERTEKSEILSGQTDTMKALDNEISGLTELLKTMINLKINKLETENEKIIEELEVLNDDFKKFPVSKRAYNDMARIYEMYYNMFVFFRQKRAEAGILKASNEANSRIVDKASAQVDPVFPRKSVNYAVSGIIGFALPLIVILLKELLYDKVEFRKQVEKLTSLPIIGMIGHNRYASNLVVLEHPKSAMAESFRVLRSNLTFFKRGGDDIKTILITSGISVEGKSFCSLNLASVLALSGRKTVLVELDLRKPRLFGDFSLGNERGISNYLAGFVGRDEIIRPTPYENLDLISAGPVPPNPAELTISEKLRKLLQSLKEDYHYVVIDTPPMGIVADALNLTKMADINVFVVRKNHTAKQVFQFFNEVTKRKAVENATILLNDFQVFGKYNSYGYANSEESGYYAEEEKEPKQKRQLGLFKSEK